MANLNEKVVVITGASSGIGKATALAFARKGSSVVLAARREDKLLEIRNHILEFNPNCICVMTDVTDPEDVSNLFDQAYQKFGKVDILINNAGCGLKSEVIDITTDQWHKLIETNLTSVFLCSKQAATRMIQSNTHGHIITVSSIAGLFAGPTYSAYCASKHGVTGFVRALKWEMRKHKIRVSAIYPARVDTEFFDGYENKPPKRQMLAASDIANYLVALATRCPLTILHVRQNNFFKRIASFYRLK